MKITECREMIDEIDTQILALLDRRTELSHSIGRSKATAGLTIRDPDREAEVIARIKRDNPGEMSDEAAVRIFEMILAESRSMQASAAAESVTRSVIY